jgi:protein-tyrosine phosphatase
VKASRGLYWLLPGLLAGRPGPRRTPWNPAELWNQGFRTVISLIRVRGTQLEAAGLRHHRAPLGSMALFGFQRRRLVRDLLPLIDLIAGEIAAGRPTLVHCRAGKDRTGALLAGYLVRHRGLSPEEAVRTLREANPVAMTAPGFVRLPGMLAKAGRSWGHGAGEGRLMDDDWLGRTRRSRPSPDTGDDLRIDDRGSRSRQEARAIPPHVWVMGFVLLLMLITICGLWGLLLVRDGGLGRPTPTMPASTPSPVSSPSPTPTEIVEPTPTISPDIALGSLVRVAGTEGQGLSLRAGPGSTYTRMDIALDGEVFVVADGPTRASGATWWKLRDPDDPERSYWAVANYLEPAAQP